MKKLTNQIVEKRWICIQTSSWCKGCFQTLIRLIIFRESHSCVYSLPDIAALLSQIFESTNAFSAWKFNCLETIHETIKWCHATKSTTKSAVLQAFETTFFWRTLLTEMAFHTYRRAEAPAAILSIYRRHAIGSDWPPAVNALPDAACRVAAEKTLTTLFEGVH